jgi:serine/threonine protein kinase/WD40 repeat protein
MSPAVQKIRDLFVAAVKVPPEQWQAFLQEACAGDEELRRRVSELLQEHQQAGGFLDRPVAEPRATDDSDTNAEGDAAAVAPEACGTLIGPYKLLELIGEGGMGSVWMAEQKEPVQRHVALKIVKAGMDSRQAIVRFEAERQALALMDHPNIAKVFDGGTTANGRPFFVMELVKGVPITRYCDEQRLTPRARLELFLPVCWAIQHAHQKGIIHRDIKPSNVLVAPNDGRPVPKVIDFGIAKATGQRLTERTLFTTFGAVVGTLEYMSPEQAELNNQDIDTRSDIYALGVLLYELLTGTTPLSRERLKQAAFTELLRLIREEEPPRPSARLSESKEALPSISAQRRMEPATLTKVVRGELDWIVMKALEKDRSRRYETANSLAMDLQHYLADEPVQACPPSLAYRFRKFARRNKGRLAIVGLLFVGLVLALAGSLVSMSLIKEQRDQALRSEATARQRLCDALLAQAQAARRSGRAGQRFGSLDALAEAARLARERGAPEEDLLKLRNEAIACLALPDLRFERTLLENVPQTYWIDFDPEFRFFAWSDLEGTVRVRRVADGTETTRLPGPGAATQWVDPRFSPDGRWLRVGYSVSGRPPRVVFYEFREGKTDFRFELDHPCDFSPDGRLLAGYRPDGTISVYELPSGRLVKQLTVEQGAEGVIFHPDGRHLLVLVKADRRLLLLVDRETGKEVARYAHPQPVDGLSWRSDGRLLAVGCVDQRIYVWDQAQQRLQSVLEGHASLGIQVLFSNAGEFLISTAWDGNTRLWDPVSGRQLVCEPASHCVALRRDGRQLALLKDGHLTLWEVADGRECRTLHHGMVGNRTPRPRDWGPRNVSLSPEGRLLASSSLDGVRLWDLAHFAEVGHLPAGPTAAVLFHPDGESLFAYGPGGLQRWPIQRQPARDQAPGGSSVPRGLRIGPPQALDVPGNWAYAGITTDHLGRRLAVVDFRGEQVIVLDYEERSGPSGKPYSRKLILQQPGVAACRLSPDGRWALTWTPPDQNGCSANKVWDLTDGKTVSWSPPGEDEGGFFTADGSWLVTRPPGKTLLRSWRVPSWEPGPTLPKPSPVRAAPEPSPDGILFSWRQGISPWQLLDGGTGNILATLEPPSDVEGAFCFSPDGTWFVSATANHTIHVWDLRAIRRGLSRIGLDWDRPPYPPVEGDHDLKPIRVEVQARASKPRSGCVTVRERTDLLQKKSLMSCPVRPSDFVCDCRSRNALFLRKSDLQRVRSGQASTEAFVHANARVLQIIAAVLVSFVIFCHTAAARPYGKVE